MSGSPFVPLIFAALIGIAVLIVGWIAMKSARSQESRRQEAIVRHSRAIELYTRAIELSESGQKLAAESNSLTRELIAELRASRRSPGPPPSSEKTSN
jgi:hypothetical protein